MPKAKVTQLKTPFRCSICQGDIDVHPGSNWTRGHNAEPVNDGRCCSECNSLVVIPMRLRILLASRKED